MTDTPTSTAVERADKPEPSSGELADLAMQRRAVQFSKAVGLLPKPLQGKPAEIYLIMQKAAGLGVPEGEALSNLYPIEGRLVPSAQLQAALVRRAGHRIAVVEQDREKCVVRARRREDPDEDTRTVTYSVADAADAGLLDEWVERKVQHPGDQYARTEKCAVAVDGQPVKDLPDWAAKALKDGAQIKKKDNWWRYRQDMLRARAISQACRSLFSDCLLGIGGQVDWTDDDVERAETRAQAHGRREPEPAIPDDDPLDELVPLEDEPADPDPGPEGSDE